MTRPSESTEHQTMPPQNTSYGNLGQLPPGYHELADIGAPGYPSAPPPSYQSRANLSNVTRQPSLLASLNPLSKTPAITTTSAIEMNTLPAPVNANRPSRSANNRRDMNGRKKRNACCGIIAFLMLVGVGIAILYVVYGPKVKPPVGMSDPTLPETNSTRTNSTQTDSTKTTLDAIYDGMNAYDECIIKHPYAPFLWCGREEK